jgi:hypothetical protein
LPLPDAAYIVSRYGATGDKATQFTSTYSLIVPVALSIISTATELLIPAADVVNERMDLSGKVDFLMPARWPVTAITSAKLYGNQVLRVGSNQSDIFTGKADVTIGEDGEIIALSPWLANGRLQGAPIFVNYYAGLDVFKDDLKEVFCQLCWLIAKERDRVGLKSERMDVAQTNFTRALPDWAQLVLNDYRRVQMYV